MDNRDEDVMNKIVDSLSRRMYIVVIKYKLNLKLTHMQMIGCDKFKLRKHLENKFTENMSFDNYGKWEVDHIKPTSLCDPNNIEEIKNIFDYKNLQPLWKKENQQKSNKYEENVREANRA